MTCANALSRAFECFFCRTVSDGFVLTARAGFYLVERVTGIEPASSAWKAEVLPLNYTRVFAIWRLDQCSVLFSVFLIEVNFPIPLRWGILYEPRGVAQLGSALALGARCRRFKSCHPDERGRKRARTGVLVFFCAE